tara:strand:+ start:1498 stop:1932 length:435 start_codon:yes stop_codon:yes gene_type:complete
MSWKNWDNNFLDMAELVSKWSKDPSTKVGAVIVDDNNRVISVGYNGFPQNIEDNDRLLERETKYNIVVHAEANALLFASRTVKGCTLYTYPFQPCSRCASLIIQSGIKRVVTVFNNDTRWVENFKLAKSLFSEAGIRMDYYNHA